ncbi:hypothetical protein CGRA01v4_09188 [Colletotrichum graminicola]|nr:hypothetical protein CGRA01v4_09188 [Colletotrichum graminicola]
MTVGNGQTGRQARYPYTRNNVSSKRPALSALAHKSLFISILFSPLFSPLIISLGRLFLFLLFFPFLSSFLWTVAFSSLISAYVIPRSKMICPFHDMIIGKALRRPKAYRNAGNPL